METILEAVEFLKKNATDLETLTGRCSICGDKGDLTVVFYIEDKDVLTMLDGNNTYILNFCLPHYIEHFPESVKECQECEEDDCNIKSIIMGYL